ncbi:MAG: Asp23/Gls24 family envelope stress response protein [Clostridia bacterium]|nr:Asp23/Gls24 family envelope stress response protein [Clostridia bacterium]
MRMDTQNGVICIANNVVASVAGAAAAACFGVRGMAARSPMDGLFHLLRGEKQTQGVSVRTEEGCVELDLHVALDSGVNIRTTCRNLQHQVRYRVQQTCGVTVGKIRVFVEAVKA